MTRWLLLGGVIGPVVFVAAFLVLGATREGYDAARTMVSQLSLGDQGWQMIAAFVVGGVLIAGFAVGLRGALGGGPGSTWGPILVGVAGVGLVVAGVFVTDPALGYPAGAPTGFPTASSSHGVIHLLAALGVFVGLPAAEIVMARRFRADGNGGWALYSWLTAGVGLAAYALAVAGPSGVDALLPVVGIMQRISIVVGFGWIAQLAWHVSRGSAAAAAVA